MRNKYIKYTHISERKFRDILRFFSLDIEAEKAAKLTGISRQTINKFYTCFRERIAELCEAESPFENGEIELDESYFGARRVRGKRGRGAQGKTPVFGMLKRGDRVYTQVVKSCSASQLMPLFRVKLALMQLYIPTDLKPTTDWLILGIKSIIESSMVRMNLLSDSIISMALRTSGGSVKCALQSSEECISIRFICT